MKKSNTMIMSIPGKRDSDTLWFVVDRMCGRALSPAFASRGEAIAYRRGAKDMARIKVHRGMMISEAEQIMAWVEYHEEPETTEELIWAFACEAKARGFRKTATSTCTTRLHEQWETAGRVYA